MANKIDEISMAFIFNYTWIRKTLHLIRHNEYTVHNIIQVHKNTFIFKLKEDNTYMCVNVH